ncbi:MAG TPA: hypothetical protein QF617_14830, partial [Arenicellales bacterium]|nr:hypothetical protein [Arenicellales bacterium]
MMKLKKYIFFIMIGLFVFTSCSSTRQIMSGNRRGMVIPESAEPYPEPTPRSLLLGKLTPPRTCYDVTFYDMNIEIDIDSRTIAGYVDFHSIAMDN